MAILKAVEIHYAKLDPARPDKGMSATPGQTPNPNWNLQIRTKDKAVRTAWQGMGIKVKTIRKDKDDEESPILYYQATLRKNAKKKEGDTLVPAAPVEVIDGKQKPINPSSIGNGSIANLILFERKYQLSDGKGGMVDKTSWILMKVQIVRHVVYVHKPMEEFEDCETEVIIPDETLDSGGAPSSNNAADDDGGLY